MGRGKFKGKPTGHRNFSTIEEINSDTSTRPRTFRQKVESENVEEKGEGGSEDEVEEEEPEKRKGTGGVIEVENPNQVKPRVGKTKLVNIGKTTELSRREREEIEKQKAHERYMKLQEQGLTDQARKNLERLAVVRLQRAAEARRREEEKDAKKKKKAEAQCS